MTMSTRNYAIAGTAIAITGLLAMYLLPGRGGDDPFADCRSSVIAGGAGQIGGSFTLTDQNGSVVTDADVLKKPSLVYFGYTFCPDVCPVDTARNADTVDVLDGKGYDVTPVFISVDPRRDTPDVLKSFAENIHPRMIALTGTPDQIKAVAQKFKTVFSVPQNPADDNYLVDHMTMTYLMLPGHGFEEVYPRDMTPEGMAASVACYLDRAKP